MSVISFIADVEDNKQNICMFPFPIQISPAPHIITESYIEEYPQCLAQHDIIVHASYITKLFSSVVFSDGNYIISNIRMYNKLCTRIGAKYLLLHFASNDVEFMNINQVLPMLSTLMDANVELLMEDVFVSTMRDAYEYYHEMIRLAQQFKFYLCFDTAHMHSNGLTVDEMLEVFTHAGNLLKVIHLNGNSNPPHKSDMHVPMFTSDNRIKDCSKLVEWIRDHDVICIVEQTGTTRELSDWIKYFGKDLMKDIISSKKKLRECLQI